MSYYIIGSNYELSDTTLSSKIAFDNNKLQALHTMLLEHGLADCSLIISTCNRSEVFVYKRQVENLDVWTTRIRELIFEVHGLSDDYINHFYQKVNYQACLHLFKVACGLDSLVLGEPQITGQIKDAMNYTEQFYHAHQIKIPAEFYKLLSETFACAKEVRSRTTIGKYAVSIAYMACKIARNLLEHFDRQQILLIGASQTNLLLARHLIRNGITDIKVVNRTYQNGMNFINELGLGELHNFQDLEGLLTNSTLVFSSTSSNEFILTQELLQKVQAHRDYQNILLFDLAIPNDIDPATRNITGVNLYNRDDLQTLVDINKQKRYDAAKDCIPILNKYLNHFKEQNRILQGNEIIVEYRNAVHQHRINLVSEAKQAIARGEDPEAIIENLSYALTNKILHTPTLMLSSFIKNGQACELNTIHEFLDREDKETLQTVVDSTLSKDVFKNSCCRSIAGEVPTSCCRNQAITEQDYIQDFNNHTLPVVATNTVRFTDLSQDYAHVAKTSTAKQTHTSNLATSAQQFKASATACPFHQQVAVAIPAQFEDSKTVHTTVTTTSNDDVTQSKNSTITDLSQADSSKCPFHQHATSTGINHELANSQVPVANVADSMLKATKTNNKVALSSYQEITGVFIPSELDETDNQVLNELVMIVDNTRDQLQTQDNFIVENPITSDHYHSYQLNHGSVGLVKFKTRKPSYHSTSASKD